MSMNTDTRLGRILIVGPRNDKQALWQINARAARVPKPEGAEDDRTPGVHAMRTLHMRSIDRRIETADGPVRFYDPTLLDLFVAQGDDNGSFELSVFGREAQVALVEAGRIDVTPLRAQPGYNSETPTRLFVTPFESTVGKLTAPKPDALLGVLPFLDQAYPVDFDRQGIEYTAQALTPDGGTGVSTRVRLAWNTEADTITLTLLPDRQTADTTAAWLQSWRAMRTMAERLHVTAWARLEFDIGNVAPALSWPVTRKSNGKLELSWAAVQLPEGLLRMTMSDQPAESQLLAPEMLMTLIPQNVSIKRVGDQIEFDSPAIDLPDLEYSYTHGSKPVEVLGFPKPLAMVHLPAQARSALRRAYDLQPPFDQGPLTGFLQEAGGWVELPVAADAVLPPRIVPRSDPVRAHGSMLVGVRRQELHTPEADSLQVPWSVRIDSPSAHEIHLRFVAGEPQSVRILMQESTARATGMVWLANRAPDGHDALPVVDADPTAFFDIELDRADASKPAPFTLHGLMLHAPIRPLGGWDDPSQPRATRAPTLDTGFGFTVNFAVMSAKAIPRLRAWLRHASLPAIQCMPATRSDTTSPRPHASRSLSLFEQTTGKLTFNNASAMAPSIDTLQRQKFEAVDAQSLVVLSLPGIELLAGSPLLYKATGHFGLPLLDEVYARATLPLPPGADAPPPPSVTALQPEALKVMWAEQARLRQVAATRSDLMFGPGQFDTAIPMDKTALAEPRVLDASATVSHAVRVNGKGLAMGLVTFMQASPKWSWEASGDALLAGPDARLDFATAGSVAIGQGAARLLGWTFAERTAAGVVMDGRGVGWANDMQARAGINWRELEIEGAGRRSLASTVAPLAVGGTGGAEWRLAFTDLPMPGAGAGTWTPNARAARLDPFAQGWTWALYPAQASALGPLPLHDIFRFAPAALTSVEIGASGLVDKVTAQGALTLGVDNPSHASNSNCRAAFEFAYDAKQDRLLLASIKPLDDSSARIRWDLDATYEESVITSGVSQLSAKPVLKPDGIHLLAAQLDVTLFGGRTTVALGDISPGATVTWVSPAPAPADLELRLTAIEIDLKTARLLSLRMSAGIRKGVRADISETLSLPRGQRVAATLEWFGNTSTWRADIDDLRRTVCLDTPSGTNMSIFPGSKDASIEQGMVCLTLSAPATDGKCGIVTHFAEVVLAAGDLRVSHLMHSDGKGGQDQLRFDGKLRRSSLVTWPELEEVRIGTADSVQVQFATSRKVTHTATFLLSDHRLSGAQVQAAKGAGLALLAPKAGSAPLTWLAEATHDLTWHRADVSEPHRVVQCLQVLQLWGASSLAGTIREQSAHFGFTPSYTAGDASSEFPNHGVRQVAFAFSGLFEPGIGKQIGDLGEQWLMLGNISALCPLAAADRFQPLHLPFIGAVHEGAHLDKLRDELGRRPIVDARLRMSRHDVLGTAMHIDAAGATPAGLLAAPAPAMAIAFGRAAAAPDSLSGAALGAGWFRTDGQPSEAGVHVEQFQFPGPADVRPKLPHPFPRAAVMLDFYSRVKPAPGLPALSVLVQSVGAGARFAVKVKTVQTQPAVDSRGAVEAPGTVAELIIGDATGIGTRLVDLDAGQGVNARALLALAMEFTGEPSFLVLRHGGYLRIELPERRRDQLAFASRPLRSATTFAIDGRLTWPEPAQRTGMLDKAALQAGFAARSPFQQATAGPAGLHGRLTPARVAGQTFSLGENNPVADSVWLQEWEQVAFAVESGDTEDASPRQHDSAVAVQPMAPSAGAVAAGIRRMDPVLAKLGVARVQTYLPPLIEDIDLPTRMGCMSESGLRLLRTWGDGAGRQDVQALAGSAMTRAMRTPRPAATPPNTGGSSTWRRTVGLYAMPGASCLALKGAWDMLAAEPGAAGMPPWSILFGKASRAGVEMGAANQAGVWRGAVRVACEVFVSGENGKVVREKRPAHFVLAVLEREKASVRAGLRWGEAWIAFGRVHAADDKHLEFQPVSPVAPLNGATGGRFECGWLVGSGAYSDTVHAPVDLPPYVAPASLDPAALRKLALKLPGLGAGDYPLPLIERTVFFSDPAFDRRLSRVKALSDSADDSAGKLFSFWIDRPSVTPAESLVLRAFAADNRHPVFVLRARVKRKGDRSGGITALKFDLAAPAELDGGILIDSGVYLALPLTILSDAGGTRLAAGDVLILDLATRSEGGSSVRLAIPVRAQSALSPPDALYSLIAVNPQAFKTWCAAHSAAPQPEGLATHVMSNADGERVLRRGLFKWRTTQPADKVEYGYSICKTELATESMHVPDEVEPELPPQP